HRYDRSTRLMEIWGWQFGVSVKTSTQGIPGLSPFTLWTLDFSPQGNEWIDLTKIKTVKLKFSGKYIVSA
ncbi:MAG: hypothetical protein ACJAX5_003453, partial [Patiriisocius sp.]